MLLWSAEPESPAGLIHLCHKRAIRLALLCADTGFFATCRKCFRAGLVLGK